jgi:hypothetical protein
MWEEGEFTRNQMKLSEESHRQAAEDRRRNNETHGGGGGGGGGGSDNSGWGILILLGIVGFILYKIYMFIKDNWVSIVTILGICVVCAIACFIIQKKSKRLTVLFTAFTVLASIGLIIAVLYLGPRETKAFFVNLQHMIPKREQQAIKEPTPTSTSIYAYVTSDALNVRARASVDSEIVGQLLKDQRIEIVDNSGQWKKIKSENIEGYVASDYLRYE